MTVPPVIVAEDEWSYQFSAKVIGEALGTDVLLVDTYDELTQAVDALAEDPGAVEPLVVLDAGIPGVCRLDVVRRSVTQMRRARIVLWTAVDHPAVHVGALIDGAFAAIPKVRSLPTLSEAIRRAASGRRSCEPDQAQFLLDLLGLMERQRTHGEGGTWQDGEVRSLPTIDAAQARLLAVARGEPMPANDAWFAEILDVVRPRWLPPYLRRALVALSMHTTRGAAAEALGIKTTTLNGYAINLSGRLMPARHLHATFTDDRRDHAFVRALRDVHPACGLEFDEHDLRLKTYAGGPWTPAA